MLKILESNQTRTPCGPLLHLKILSTVAHDNCRGNILDILDTVTVHRCRAFVHRHVPSHTYTVLYHHYMLKDTVHVIISYKNIILSLAELFQWQNIGNPKHNLNLKQLTVRQPCKVERCAHKAIPNRNLVSSETMACNYRITVTTAPPVTVILWYNEVERAVVLFF